MPEKQSQKSKPEKESAALADVTEILWEDLIPDDFVPPENPYINMSEQEIDKLMDGSGIQRHNREHK